MGVQVDETGQGKPEGVRLSGRRDVGDCAIRECQAENSVTIWQRHGIDRPRKVPLVPYGRHRCA